MEIKLRDSTQISWNSKKKKKPSQHFSTHLHLVYLLNSQIFMQLKVETIFLLY